MFTEPQRKVQPITKWVILIPYKFLAHRDYMMAMMGGRSRRRKRGRSGRGE